MAATYHHNVEPAPEKQVSTTQDVTASAGGLQGRPGACRYRRLASAAVAKLREVLEYRDLPMRNGMAHGRATERSILNEGTR